MRRIKLRDDIEPQEIQTNGCTNRIRIHPINSTTLFFYRDDDEQIKGCFRARDRLVSLISFDKRHWWTCFYYDMGEHGWVCERDNIYLRLSEKDFIKVFGKIRVLGNGVYSYHEEP